jgi:hypothetical protein
LIERRNSAFPEYLEAAFHCDDEVLSDAKLAFSLINQYGFKQILGNAVLNSAEFTTVTLVSILVVQQLGVPPDILLGKILNEPGLSNFLRESLMGSNRKSLRIDYDARWFTLVAPAEIPVPLSCASPRRRSFLPVFPRFARLRHRIPSEVLTWPTSPVSLASPN